MKRRFFVWLASGVVAIATVAWIGWTHRGNDEIQVQTAAVTRGSVARRIIVAGSMQAVKTVDVGSQVSGLIASIEVDFDAVVHKGQVLARIDPVLFQAALDNAKGVLDQAEGSVAQLEGALEFARTELNRAGRLLSPGLIQQADFDTAKANFDQAVAALDAQRALAVQAQGGVDQAQVNLDHTIITSPLDGIVINRAVDVGQTVAASFQAPVLFTLAASLQQMQVYADVDEADISAVKAGQTATFVIEAYPNETFSGTITQVRLQPGSATPSTSSTSSGATTGAATAVTASSTAGVTYTVLINVANPDDRLRPGMTATIVLNGSEHSNVVRIPNQALLFRPSLDLLKAVGESATLGSRAGASGDEELAQVWRYDGKRFTPVGITLGLSDARWTEEGSGPLEPGDLVVTNTSFTGQFTAKK
jgi:HlyD family secretion protein